MGTVCSIETVPIGFKKVQTTQEHQFVKTYTCTSKAVLKIHAEYIGIKSIDIFVTT